MNRLKRCGVAVEDRRRPDHDDNGRLEQRGPGPEHRPQQHVAGPELWWGHGQKHHRAPANPGHDGLQRRHDCGGAPEDHLHYGVVVSYLTESFFRSLIGCVFGYQVGIPEPLASPRRREYHQALKSIDKRGNRRSGFRDSEPGFPEGKSMVAHFRRHLAGIAAVALFGAVAVFATVYGQTEKDFGNGCEWNEFHEVRSASGRGAVRRGRGTRRRRSPTRRRRSPTPRRRSPTPRRRRRITMQPRRRWRRRRLLRRRLPRRQEPRRPRRLALLPRRERGRLRRLVGRPRRQ